MQVLFFSFCNFFNYFKFLSFFVKDIFPVLIQLSKNSVVWSSLAYLKAKNSRCTAYNFFYHFSDSFCKRKQSLKEYFKCHSFVLFCFFFKKINSFNFKIIYITINFKFVIYLFIFPFSI